MAIIISSDSPTFKCQSPACYIDAESIDTSFVYDSNYAESCDINGLITVGGGEAGEDGADGADGTDGLAVVTADAGGSTVGDAEFASFAGRVARQYDAFINTNGGDKVYWTRGTTVWSNSGSIIGADGATGATGATGNTGATGAAGSNGSNGADGATITADANVPTGGNNGDLHIRTTTYDLYEKAAGVWGIIGNVQGATGAAGAAGSDGIDGDQWTHSATIPTSTTQNDFDSYHLYTVNNNVYYKAELGTTWAIVGNLNGDTYATTSTTSVNLTTTTVGDTVVLTVDAGLAWSTGQFAVVANSVTEQFTGKVTSYSSTTLTLVVTYILGTSTLTSWDINLAGVVESGTVPQWYTITATAGTGSIASRVFTAPSGWTVDSSDNVSVSGLGSNVLDLTIKHDTGLYGVECVVFGNDGSKYTKLLTPVSYATMYDDLTHIAVELSSFCTLAQALLIYLKLQ